MTRSSILTIAADLGYVVEERQLVVAEVLDWARRRGCPVGHGGGALRGGT